MRFTHPLMLLLALGLPWLWWAAARRRQPVNPASIAWRATTALLAILAGGGLTVRAGDAPITAVVALDRSASVPLGAQQRALARVEALRTSMRQGDRLSLVSFGADAAIEWRPLEASQSGAVHATVSEAGTDIGGALRLARALLSNERQSRILLISDGRDNSGHAEREALRAAAAGIPIDIAVPAIDGASLPPMVTRVTAPDNAAVREPYEVSIEVSGTPGSRGRILLSRDDRVVSTSDIVVGEDGTAGLTVTERQDMARSYVYRASMQESDDGPTSHSAGAVVVVEGQPAILYVSDSTPLLRTALVNAGFTLHVVRPEQMPGAQQLAGFAGVVLDDIPADRLDATALEALAAYVENTGGGLLLLGSARTLTLSGYPATAVNRILPLDLRPRSGQRGTPLDLVIVFDKSGSMSEMAGGVSMIEIARQAVAEAVRVMPARDAVGVLAFDSHVETVVPIAPGHDAGALRAALDKVRPNGSTSISAAIEAAFQWLHAQDRPPAARRHIVLISDGRTSDDDAARLLGLARTGGVELSVVAIGSAANRRLLEELARSTGGRAYFSDDIRELPRMVAREAARSSAGTVLQERFVPRAAAHPALAGLAGADFPALNGYVVSAAKPSATAILASHLDDPILCAWRAGLGRVAVFTADLGSAWSAHLRAWPSSDRMWIQTMRWLSRRETHRSLRVRIRDDETRPRLEIDAEEPDGSSLRFDTLEAVVRPPAGADSDIIVEPVSPGRYAATVPVSGTGLYVVAVTAVDHRSATEYHVVRPIYWSADHENAVRGTDVPFLSHLATLTGGRLLAGDEGPFDGPRRRDYRDASRWLAAAALAMFVLGLFDGRRLVKSEQKKWRMLSIGFRPWGAASRE